MRILLDGGPGGAYHLSTLCKLQSLRDGDTYCTSLKDLHDLIEQRNFLIRHAKVRGTRRLRDKQRELEETALKIATAIRPGTNITDVRQDWRDQFLLAFTEEGKCIATKFTEETAGRSN